MMRMMVDEAFRGDGGIDDGDDDGDDGDDGDDHDDPCG